MKTKAFTLIELLVVVAVIGILVAIAMVNLRESRRRALIAQCAANLKTVGTALASYKLDYGEFPYADGIAGRQPSPHHTDPGNGPAAGGSWDGVPWELVDLGYVSDPRALYCPVCRARHPGHAERFRYAYNHSARDTGGSLGGAEDIERGESGQWLARCVWLPSSIGFGQAYRDYTYPHGDDPDDPRWRSDVLENVLYTDLRVELINGRRDYDDRTQLGR